MCLFMSHQYVLLLKYICDACVVFQWSWTIIALKLQGQHETYLDPISLIDSSYGLTVEEIESLPQIDTSKTLIQEVCPPYLSNVECHPGKYRRLDGLCNNIDNPSWGATMTPFTRSAL